jgi:hypothetical protein
MNKKILETIIFQSMAILNEKRADVTTDLVKDIVEHINCANTLSGSSHGCNHTYKKALAAVMIDIAPALLRDLATEIELEMRCTRGQALYIAETEGDDPDSWEGAFEVIQEGMGEYAAYQCDIEEGRA